MGPILEIKGVSKSFEGVLALNNLDVEVSEGEIRAIIGPNGSGKTTLINVITGVFPATSGRIIFKGQDITGLSPFRIARKGITRTFQNLRLFPSLTVLEHVLAAQHHRSRVGFWGSVFSTRSGRAEEEGMVSRAQEILEFVGLKGRADMPGLGLPYGQRRLLEIARALATGPELLLLDEPAAGLSSEEIQALERLLREIRSRGITVILVEHRMMLVMNVADRITVLNYGEKIAEGKPAEIKNNPEVIQAYLGRAYAAAGS
ncbi:MAG TPA: ABC transporter ATP-binding protein [Firmicutes bacterium]|nr:ABC transporter ATP-binding protein [Bacillota bacterium]